jgi:capsular exopolysaccharide synthesis family protein
MYFGPALQQIPQYQLPSGLHGAQGEPPGHTDIASTLGTLWRRRRAFLSILLGFFALVVLWTLVEPKTYTGTVKLIAGSSTQNATRVGDTSLPVLNALLAASSTMTAETYVDLIQEDPVARTVIRNLKLKISVGKLLQYHVQVKPVPNTSILYLAATWGDPKTAVAIANEFATVFVNRERELIANQAGSAIDFLSQEMPRAEAAMRKADAELARFVSNHPNVYVGATGAPGTAVLAAQQKYATNQIDLEQAQAQLKNVTAQMASMNRSINGASNVVQNPIKAQLQQQLAQVNVQLDAARRQYTEAHPTVQALKEQQAQLEREIGDQAPTIVAGNSIVPNPVYQQLSQQAASLSSQIAGDQSQMKAIAAQLGEVNGAGNSLPTQTNQLASLQRNATMAEDIYTALQQKYSEAVVSQTTALSDVSITQPAAMNTVGMQPVWWLNLILGFVLGLVLAVSGVFAIDFFDNTFKDEADVQRVLPLPLLATVPQLTASKPSRLPWLRALTVESFLQLVTGLRYSSAKPLRSLVITSPNQGDGKTTVALSTAIAMAEIEPKVVLIDADLRRPKLHERLGLAAGPGLSNVLVGECSASEAISATKYDGLYLLGAGTLVPNPVKLIHSPQLDNLIAELLQEYRAVIFDTPALQPVYDAAILAAKVDGAVLVVSAGMTDMPSTKKALQRLSSVQGVNMIGVVLNRATPSNGYAAYYLNTDSPTPLPHEEGVSSAT